MGISNFEIERVFKTIDNNNLDENFVGVFPSNNINKFFDIAKMMKGKKKPFLIGNTDRSDKPGTHWWSILDIDLKRDFLLFDSFGVLHLRNFIVQDDEKIVKKVLKGVDNIAQDKTELSLVKVSFSANGYNKLLNQDKLSLSETASNLFHFIESFTRYEKQNVISMWTLEDPIQEITSYTCGAFQVYFYNNLFFPDNNSKIHEYKKLTKEAVQNLLNEIFSVDPRKNEQNIEQYIRQKQINIKRSQ